MDDPLRVYFDPAEIGPDGYPYAWIGARNVAVDPGVVLLHPSPPAVKDLIRERAEHRCERCRHPFVVGETPGEWSPCDAQCTHVAPIRWRYYYHEPWWEYPSKITPVFPDVDAMRGRGAMIEAQWRVLTVHHLNGVKHDLRWWNLAALCQRCHLTIQGKVILDRAWAWEHSDWFKPHAAGYYHALDAEEAGESELPQEEVLSSMEEILAIHNMLGRLP